MLDRANSLLQKLISNTKKKKFEILLHYAIRESIIFFLQVQKKVILNYTPMLVAPNKERVNPFETYIVQSL